jgi:hypothetical protein
MIELADENFAPAPASSAKSLQDFFSHVSTARLYAEQSGFLPRAGAT